jgi:hypothetical protein
MSEEKNREQSSKDRKPETVEEVNSNTSQDRVIQESKISSQASEVSKSEIENMEVQKHPHHVTHKKKWEEYLLEFFMLFLAVFLGFVAENVRETSVEHERETQYAQQLYTEFYADSIAFAGKINARMDKEKDCDYIYSYIKDSSLTDLPKKFYPAYTTVFYLINSYTFEPKDGVLSQLKSSGSLRYFKDPVLQKLFGDISVAINNVRYRNEQEYQFFANPIKPFILQHYDFKWVDNVRKMSANAYYLDLLKLYLSSDTLIKADILNLPTFNRNEAANMVMFYKTMMVSSRTLQMNDYIKTNEKILQALRKNYSLKNG